MLVKLPLDGDQSEVAVTVITKTYGLVQHQEVFGAAVTALEKANLALDQVHCELTLTEHGERMALRFTLPQDYSFDPGDGNRLDLRLEMFNSVDGSSRLWIMLGWFRFVCSNGLFLGLARLNARLIHHRRINVTCLKSSFCKALESVERERRVLKQWTGVRIERDSLVKFVDQHLSRRWGSKAAARVFLISTSGHDGRPSNPFERALPHRRHMILGKRVPGSPARAETVYGIAQALSWVANDRPDLQDRLQRMRELPSLIRTLIEG